MKNRSIMTRKIESQWNAKNLMVVAFGISLTASYMQMPVRDAQVALLGRENTWMLIVATTILALPVSSFSSRLVKNDTASTASAIALFYRSYAIVSLAALGVLPKQGSIDNGTLWELAGSVVFYLLTESLKLLSISLLWSFASDCFDAKEKR